MCSNVSQALLPEQQLKTLAARSRELRHSHKALLQECTRAHNSLRDLMADHGRLRQEHATLWEEHDAMRYCLALAGLLPSTKLKYELSRRRAPSVLKKVLEVKELSSSIGLAAGTYASMRLSETSRSYGTSIRSCLPEIARRLPPHVYVVGGKNDGSNALATVECYSHDTGKWGSLPPMTTGRYGCAAAAVGGFLYVAGGHDGIKALSSVERFDPNTGRWESMPPMPTARSRCAAAAVEGKLHIIGGRDSRNSSAAPPTECFDPKLEVWEVLPSTPLAALGCTVAKLNGALYVVGVNSDCRDMAVACFEPETARWCAMPSVPRQRIGCAAAGIDGSVYVAGGHDGLMAVATIERFNPSSGFTGFWEPLPDAPTARHGCAAVAAAGQLYIVGGDDGRSLAAVERYNPATQVWESLPPLPTGRFGCAAAAMWA